MNAIHRRRLRKLANHLLTGKLGHKKFDFGVLSEGPRVGERNCGTAGCALGECPVVFPLNWKFDSVVGFRDRLVPVLRGSLSGFSDRSFRSAETFFGLSPNESALLFAYAFEPAAVPGYPGYLGYPGVRELTRDVTRKQVARNILAFLKVKEKQLKA